MDRWYDPYLNRFTQPDTIISDPYNSQNYDRYSYTLNNPLKYTDPSGHCIKNPEDGEDFDCWEKVKGIQNQYENIGLDGSRWTLDELSILEDSLNDIDVWVGINEGGEFDIKRRHVDFVYVIKWLFGNAPLGTYDPISEKMTFYNGTFDDSDLAKLTIFHEYAHSIQYEHPDEFLEYANRFWSGCNINSKCSTSGIPAKETPIEDFPETFAIALFLKVNHGNIIPISKDIIFPDTDRLEFMYSYIEFLQNRK